MPCSSDTPPNCGSIKRVFCINCDQRGHTVKHCKEPMVSFGVICYLEARGGDDACGIPPLYLAVQRKHSFNFVEFIRGKYECDDPDYVHNIFCNMTGHEKRRILTEDFTWLWREMWQENSERFVEELKMSRRKWATVRASYGTQAIALTPSIPETEWGFPKGRRNMRESARQCALREFAEETGIPAHHVCIESDVPVAEETFTGSNGMRYRHVYFLARYTAPDPSVAVDAEDPMQSKEVRDIRWMSARHFIDKIPPQLEQRKQLVRHVHSLLMSKRARSRGGSVLPPDPPSGSPAPSPPVVTGMRERDDHSLI